MPNLMLVPIFNEGIYHSMYFEKVEPSLEAFHATLKAVSSIEIQHFVLEEPFAAAVSCYGDDTL